VLGEAMKIGSLLVALTLVFCAPAALAAPPAPAPRTDYAKLFDELWKTVDARFFDPQMNGVDFAEVGRRYRPLAVAARDDAEFQAIGLKMLRELKTSHLELTRPQAADAPGWGVLPGEFQAVGGRLYLAKAEAGTDALRPGDEIIDRTKLYGELGGEAIVDVRGCDGAVRQARLRYGPRTRPLQSWSVLTSPSADASATSA
jgi:carboxyl-terminal processing protease